MSTPMPQTVAARLAAAQPLRTRAPALLGRAGVATWLREVPGSGTITLLLRAPDDDAAHQRLVGQGLTSEPFPGGLAGRGRPPGARGECPDERAVRRWAGRRGARLGPPACAGRGPRRRGPRRPRLPGAR